MCGPKTIAAHLSTKEFERSTLAINPWRANIEVWGWEIWKPWFQEIIIGPVCQSQVTPHDEWWIDVPLLLLDEWTYHFPIPHTRKYLIQNTREIQRFWPKFNTPQNPLLMLFIHSSFSANHTSKHECDPKLRPNTRLDWFEYPNCKYLSTKAAKMVLFQSCKYLKLKKKNWRGRPLSSFEVHTGAELRRGTQSSLI